MQTWTDLYIYIDGERVTDYVSFIWTDKYNEPGDFELELAYTDVDAQRFKLDSVLTCNLSPRSMIVEDIIVSISPENGKRMLVKGRSAESILDRRVIADSVIIENNTYLENKFIRSFSDLFENATRNFASIMEKGNNYSTTSAFKIGGRSLPVTLSFDSIDGNNGPMDPQNHIYDSNVQIDGTGKNYLELLQENCKLMGFGFKMVSEIVYADVYRAELNSRGGEGIIGVSALSRTTSPFFYTEPWEFYQQIHPGIGDPDSQFYKRVAGRIPGLASSYYFLDLYGTCKGDYIGKLFTKDSNLYVADIHTLDSPNWKCAVLFAHPVRYNNTSSPFFMREGYDSKGDLVQTYIARDLNGDGSQLVYYLWKRTLNKIPFRRYYFNPDYRTHKNVYGWENENSPIEEEYLWICVNCYFDDENTRAMINESPNDGDSGYRVQTLHPRYDAPVSYNSNRYDLTIYDGTDRSNEIEYSEENRNLSSFEYELSSKNYKNYAFSVGDEDKTKSDYMLIAGKEYTDENFEDDKFVYGGVYKNESENNIPIYSQPSSSGLPIDYLRPDESITLISKSGYFAKSSNTDREEWIRYDLLEKESKSYYVFTADYDPSNNDRSNPIYYKVGVSKDDAYGIEKREVYISSGLAKGENPNDKYAARLKKKGLYELVNNYKLDHESSCEVIHDFEQLYNVAFTVGDIVNVKIDPIRLDNSIIVDSIKMRIVAYTITHTDAGLDLYPSLEFYDPEEWERVNKSLIYDEEFNDEYSDVKVNFYTRQNASPPGGDNPYGRFLNNDAYNIWKSEDWHPIWPKGYAVNYVVYKNNTGINQPLYIYPDTETQAEGQYILYGSTADIYSNNIFTDPNTGIVWGELKMGPYQNIQDTESINKDGDRCPYWVILSNPDTGMSLTTQNYSYTDTEKMWGCYNLQNEGDYLQIPDYEPYYDEYHFFAGWYFASRTYSNSVSPGSTKVEVYDPNSSELDYNKDKYTRVTGSEMDLVAVYKPKSYKITWDVGDHGRFRRPQYADITRVSNMCEYNTMPKEEEVTSKDDTPSTKYSFFGWSPTVVPATQDVTYTAQWSEDPVAFKITWNSGRGGRFGSMSVTNTYVKYGEVPAAPAITKVFDGYTFAGWSPTIVPATRNASYIAKWLKGSGDDGEDQDQGDKNDEDKQPTEGTYVKDKFSYDTSDTTEENKDTPLSLGMERFRSTGSRIGDTIKIVDRYDSNYMIDSRQLVSATLVDDGGISADRSWKVNGVNHRITRIARELPVILKNGEGQFIEHWYSKDLINLDLTGETYPDMYIQAHWTNVWGIIPFNNEKASREAWFVSTHAAQRPVLGISLLRKSDDACIARWSWEFGGHRKCPEVAFTSTPIYIPYRGFAKIPSPSGLVDPYLLFIPGLYFKKVGDTYKRMWTPPLDWLTNRTNYYYRKIIGWYIGMCAQPYDDKGNLISPMWSRDKDTDVYRIENYEEYQDNGVWKRFPGGETHTQLYKVNHKIEYGTYYTSDGSSYIAHSGANNVLNSDRGRVYAPAGQNGTYYTDGSIYDAYIQSGWRFCPVPFARFKATTYGGLDTYKWFWEDMVNYSGNGLINKSTRNGDTTISYGGVTGVSPGAGGDAWVWGPTYNGYSSFGFGKRYYSPPSPNMYARTGESGLSRTIWYGNSDGEQTSDNAQFWTYGGSVGGGGVPVMKMSGSAGIMHSLFSAAWSVICSIGRTAYLKGFELPSFFTENIIGKILHVWKYSLDGGSTWNTIISYSGDSLPVEYGEDENGHKTFTVKGITITDAGSGVLFKDVMQSYSDDGTLINSQDSGTMTIEEGPSIDALHLNGLIEVAESIEGRAKNWIENILDGD